MDAFHLLLYEDFEISNAGLVNFTKMKARQLYINVCVYIYIDRYIDRYIVDKKKKDMGRENLTCKIVNTEQNQS